MRRTISIMLLTFVLLLALAPLCFAEAEAAAKGSNVYYYAMAALGCGIGIGLGAIGSGIGQGIATSKACEGIARFYLVAFIIFSGFVVARLLGFIVHAPQVDAKVLCAGVAGFLMLGLAWVPAYLAAARSTPGAFTLPAADGGAPAVLDGFNAFYFSFVTLCTVGYGDIAPVSKMARMLAVTEAITGLFYLAVLISRLVGMYSNTQPPAGGGPRIHNREPNEPNAGGQP